VEDDHPDSGFGSLAWYQMGRWSEQSAQRNREWRDSWRNPVVQKRFYDEAMQANDELAAENRRLVNVVQGTNQRLRTLSQDYARLKEWAEERQKTVETLKAQNEALKALDRKSGDLIERLGRQLYGSSSPDDLPF